MDVSLRDAMQDMLEGWQDDLPADWRAGLAPVRLGFDKMDGSLSLEPWEPIFPTRRGKLFPGAPKGAHMLRSFDDIAPDDVRCVVLGQDPYPCPAFATGRAFEAGQVPVDQVFVFKTDEGGDVRRGLHEVKGRLRELLRAEH